MAMSSSIFDSFNPRPRMGGDQINIHRIESGLVSIHAPAWGATNKRNLEGIIKRVSIHAPAWGATRDRARLFDLRDVSIHAPAWGATSCRTTRCYGGGLFQSTPPHGGRQPAVPSPIMLSEFQSTPPHWGRLVSRFSASSFHGFNPRPRMGGDVSDGYRLLDDPVSIHAPAWGATASGRCEANHPIVSIHAPAWVATLIAGLCAVPIEFHPAPQWGATGGTWCHLVPHAVSSTPPGGDILRRIV